MRIDFIKVKGTWTDIKNACRTTINLDTSEKSPDSNWKRRLLLSEHSPIRQLILKWKWFDIKRWVSDHFVRHKYGIEHWVKTDRTDRTGVNRDDLSQSSLTNHECEANAQAIINISRKRLCYGASKETIEAWRTFLESFKETEPELYSVCVPECVYRNGFCPEYETCGWNKSPAFEVELKRYIANMEHQINPKTLIK